MGWNGWQYYERNKAAGASALYDELQRGADAGDTARVERALADMKDKFSGTVYAQQAGLLAAKALRDKGNADGSRAALSWVADKAIDPGYQALARLRLSAELMDAKNYDEALQAALGRLPQGIRGAGGRPQG